MGINQTAMNYPMKTDNGNKPETKPNQKLNGEISSKSSNTDIIMNSETNNNNKNKIYNSTENNIDGNNVSNNSNDDIVPSEEKNTEIVETGLDPNSNGEKNTGKLGKFFRIEKLKICFFKIFKYIKNIFNNITGSIRRKLRNNEPQENI